MATYTPNINTDPTKATYGEKSAGVSALQTQLNEKNKGVAGYVPLKVDSLYGPLTQAATQFKAPTTSSVITNQQNLIGSTTADRSKQNEAGVNIDNTVKNNQTVDSNGNIINNTNQTNTTVDPNKTVGNMKDSLGNTYQSVMPENMSYSLPTLDAGKKWVYDSNGRAMEMDASGTVSNNALADKEYNIAKQAEKEKATFDADLDKAKANLDISHQNLIDSIKLKAQEQRTSMEDINKRYLGSKQVAGFRTGSTEYTSEIAMGILKNEEEEGVRRIKEIDDNMNILLAEAVSAKNDKDLERATLKFNKYTELRKEKENAIVNQYKMYIDNQKYISDTKKALETEARAKTDQAIQELTAKADSISKTYNSITSPTDKTNYINSLVKSMGLDSDTIMSSIIKATPKATKTSTSSGKQTSTEIKSTAIGDMSKKMEGVKGDDGYISPYDWEALREQWGINKLNDADFLKNFKRYLNPESYNMVPDFAPKTTVKSARKA